MPTNPALEDKQSELEIYETFRNYIRHEDNLTNNRITWMLSIHGFLYASYAFTIQKKLEVLEKVNLAVRNDPTEYEKYLRIGDLGFALFQTELFLCFIALVGLGISILAFRSVRAAAKASEALEAIYVHQHDTSSRTVGNLRIDRIVNLGGSNRGWILLVPGLTGGGLDASLDRGGSAGSWIPVVLFTSWILALMSSGLYLGSKNWRLLSIAKDWILS